MGDFKQLQATFPPDTVLFKENDTTREMYILLAGEVQVLKEGQVLATVKENGAFLGEMATLLNATRSATVKTVTKIVCLKVLPENIDTLFKVTPELGYKLSKTLAQRLADANTKLAHAQGSGNLGTADGKNSTPKITPAQVQASEARVAKAEPPPPAEDFAAKIAFLTRTEVHHDALRCWFNRMGETLDVESLAGDLDIPDTLFKLVVKEFVEAGLAKTDETKVTFLVHEKLLPLAEEWIFANGLFRIAS